MARPNDSKPHNRIIGLDAVRAMACLAVFASHTLRLVPEQEVVQGRLYRLMRTGDWGVSAFFVLSGFLLTMPFLRARATGCEMPNLRRYAVRRLGRIVPGFYVCVLITAAIAGTYQTRWGLFSVGTTLSFTNSLVAACYRPSFDGPLWSIGIEMMFYTLLPLLMIVLFRVSSARSTRLFLLSTMLLIVVGQALFLRLAPSLERWIADPAIFQADSWSTTRNAIVLFAHFLIGALAADVYLGIRRRIEHDPSQRPTRLRHYNRFDLGAVALLLVVLAAASSQTNFLPHIDFMIDRWPSLHLLVGASLAVLPFTRVVGPWLDNRFMRLTATLSFGIYMWHWPVLENLRRYLPYDPAKPAISLGVYAAVSFAVVFAIAACSFYLVEQPIMRWANRFDKGRIPRGEVSSGARW